MNKLVLGYVTCPNVKVATELASKAVNSKLAACGNIIPGITSVYEWQGKVETETEGTNYNFISLVVISTRKIVQKLWDNDL